MRVIEKICVFCGVIYNCLDVVTISVLTIELPKIMNPDCHNQTNLTDLENDCHNNNTWRQPGLVLAMPNLPALILGSFIGFITSKLDAKAIYGVALLSHACGSSILAWDITSFPCLIAGTLMDGLGCIMGAVAVPAILKTIFTTDQGRCRLMNVCALGRVLGYANGYYVGTLAYEFFGHRVMFGFLAGLWVTLSLVMFVIFIVDRNPNPVNQNNLQDSSEQVPLITRTELRGYSVLQNPYILLILYQTLFIQFPITAALATAPSRLQLKIGFTAEKNGMITGIALLIAFCVILSLIFLMRSNFIHVTAIIILLIPEIIGLSVYPSVDNFALALLCEAGIQCTRVCLNSLHGSLLMLISDKEHLDYPMVNSLYIMMRYGANCAGSFTAPFILHEIGFSIMYYVMAGLLAPVFLTNIIYFKVIAVTVLNVNE